MRYSLKHFAKLRVNRFQEGIRRLNRLHFLPLSRAFRQRIILQGVWTQCLHACESVKICQTAWSKLRTAAAFGMGFRCTRNPFLALAVVTNRILDPQFCAIIQSLQTCRNVGRFFPDHIDVMEMCLRERSKFQGVVALLDDRLLEIGWKYEQNFTWTRSGNRFHLFLSNMKHILNVQSQSWMCYVAKKVRHRKYLHEATSFRTFDFRHLKGLTFGQRNLLEFQMVGEQFTADVTTHFDPEGENKCKWCGLPDSKQHRFESCAAFSHVRARHPGIIAIWSSLPIEARFFSLWPCDERYEDFQSLLSLVKFPEINRMVNDELVHLFVDGSCQHQAHQDIRISSGSVVLVRPHAEFEVVWSGMTPSADQQSLRGEILAGCVATASFQKCCIYTDNSTFYSVATGIVDALRKGLTPLVPKEHSDLWVFFFRCLNGSDLHCLRFVKVKGHLDWKTQTTDYLKWTAWYNNLADLAAKQVLVSFRDACPEYVQLCRRYFRDLKRAEALAQYHVDIAEYATTGTEKFEVDEFELPVMLQTIGEIIRGPTDVFPLITPDGFNDRYMRLLQAWACNLTIFKYTESGFEDTSWLECFLIFLWHSKVRPPVRLQNNDVLADENPDTVILEGSFADGMKTFRRYVACIENHSQIFPNDRCSVVASMRSWKRTCPGFSGQISITEECENFLVGYFARHTNRKRLSWPLLE